MPINYGPHGGGTGGSSGQTGGGAGSFCQQHQTTCSVGRWLGGLFGGGAQPRSKCGTVANGATPAPWMRSVARDTLARGLQLTAAEVNATFTQAEQDAFYVEVVVPYCRAIEGEITELHPDSPAANEWRAAVYANLVGDIRSGRVSGFGNHPPGDPGASGPGGGSTGGGGSGGSGGTSSCPPGTFRLFGQCWGWNSANNGQSGGSGASGGGSGGTGGPSLASMNWVLVAALAVGAFVVIRRGAR